MSQLPRIAVTLGDPAGVGPEVVAKALRRPDLRSMARLLVVGSSTVLDKALKLVGADLRAQHVHDVDEHIPDGSVAVFGTDDDGLSTLGYGVVSAKAGAAAVEWLTTAARLAMDGRVDGVVTAPINKESASLAGYEDIGHQEIYQSMTGAEHVVTMLIASGLRVVHLTTHRPLHAACDYVTRDNVLAKLRLTHEFFRAHGFERPRIGVAALNPHSGDGGIIGTEEITAIRPAIEAAQAAGIDAVGPVPADSVFTQAIHGRYDVVLAMYHDQGHIAVKVHDWESSVTMNLGLPFLRTSVDHGTAFDIAGRGVADPTGMEQAIRLAAVIANTGKLDGF